MTDSVGSPTGVSTPASPSMSTSPRVSVGPPSSPQATDSWCTTASSSAARQHPVDLRQMALGGRLRGLAAEQAFERLQHERLLDAHQHVPLDRCGLDRDRDRVGGQLRLGRRPRVLADVASTATSTSAFSSPASEPPSASQKRVERAHDPAPQLGRELGRLGEVERAELLAGARVPVGVGLAAAAPVAPRRLALGVCSRRLTLMRGSAVSAAIASASAGARGRAAGARRGAGCAALLRPRRLARPRAARARARPAASRISVTRRPYCSSMTTTSPRAIALPLTSRSASRRRGARA